MQVKDPKVLVATAQNNMLGRLNESNRLLDEIQKGLNDYLEKKRLFFPRCVSINYFIVIYNCTDNNKYNIGIL